MKEASIMVSTKYENDDNSNHSDNNVSKFHSTAFLKSPKHFPVLDHGIFERAR